MLGSNYNHVYRGVELGKVLAKQVCVKAQSHYFRSHMSGAHLLA